MTTFASGAATHVGQVRQVNQDHVLDLVDDGLFAVADGMGGHRGGEVASEVAIDALKASFTERTTDALVDAVKSANRAIVSRAKDDPDLRGMGTTMCALAKVQLDDGDECLTVVNVGDSRAYLLKAGEQDLWQVSEDHSLVATLVRQGQLTPEEAAVHPQRNILTRALGIDQEVLPDSFALLPVKGDRYLLCSDGLFNEVEEPTIAQIMRDLTDPTAAAEELVRLANEGGGRDNISVVIVDVTDDAGHHKLLESSTDDHRVFEVVHGPERVGEPAEDELLGGGASANGGAAAVAPAPPVVVGAATAGGATVLADAPTQTGAGGPGGVVIEAGSAPITDAPAPPATHFATAAATPSRFTWRVALFLLAFIAIFAAGFYTVHYLATNSYFVGTDGNEVVIYQGRVGGLAWYQPVVVQRTGIAVSQVPGEFSADVAKGREQPSQAEAEAYVARLRARMAEANPAPTTTTTSQPGTTTTTGLGDVITPSQGPPTTTVTTLPVIPPPPSVP